MNPPEKQKYLQLIYSHPQWENLFKPRLLRLKDQKCNPMQVIESLKQFYKVSYINRQNKRKQLSTFKILYNLYEEQLPEIFSSVASLILQYETYKLKFPILYSNVQKQFTFTKKQILLLISMMVMCLICNQPARQTHKFPFRIDFSFVFSNNKYKATTVIEYLKQQFKKLGQNKEEYDKQRLTLRRLVLNRSMKKIIIQNDEKLMIKPIITKDEASIEEYFGEIKADFANKFIGGGALGQGCVQEEIMFTNHPQMFTSVLFCEVMNENEAIEFIGYKKYFKNRGYACKTIYDGHEEHKYEYDEQNRAKQYIVAIDALHYPIKKHNTEFSLQKIDRQLLKAYTGFSKSGTAENEIVSGNWGCGAFKGDLHLKFIIQWLACSLANKKLIYCPFGHRKELMNQQLFEKIQNMKVSEIYQIIFQNQNQLSGNKNIYKLLFSKIM